MFKANESGLDRGIRIVLGLAMLILGWGGFVGGWAGVILQWLGFVPLLTGIVGWCPLYSLFHISTRPVKVQAN